MALSDEQLREVAAKPWYYKIELWPGGFTNGNPRPPNAMTRDFFERVDFTGRSCLDIGTQEFVAPTLMLRQGARSVTGYDRLSLEDRLEAMKQAYGVELEYIHGMPMHALKPALKARNSRHVFDVVNFSGVLYHMIDPLAGMVMARSFLRTGGLMIIETSVKRSDQYIVEFNRAGSLYEGTNYFQVSIATLDYWIRLLRMVPIDCAWHGGDVCRMVVICRAVDRVFAEEDDRWIRKGALTNDFKAYGCDFAELESTEPEVGYCPMENVERVMRTRPKIMDLYATSMKAGSHPINTDRAILRLGDRY